MAILWADNGARLTSGQLGRLYTVGGSVATGPYGINGGPAFRLTGAGAELLAIPLNPVPQFATAILSFDLRISAAPAATVALANIRLGATVHITIAVNTSRQIAIYRDGVGGTLLGTSSYAIPLNKFVHVNPRVVIDNAGSVVVRVTESGTTTITNNLTSVDTQTGGSATWDRFTINAWSGGVNDFGSVVAQDSTGAVANDILGPDVEVEDKGPNGVGTHGEFEKRVGSVFRHENVDDPTADDDTTYNETAVVNAIDTHEFDDLLDPAITVYGLMGIWTARRSGGTVAIAPVIRQGISDTVGAAFPNLTSAYLAYQRAYSTTPAGAPWTVDEWNLIQLGYKRTT